MSHNVKNNNDFRTRIYVKSGHNASHNRVITLSELCISYKDLCINLHTRNHKKHKINFVPVLSQRWNKNDPLKPIPEVINCDNIDEIINLIDLWNCE